MVLSTRLAMLSHRSVGTTISRYFSSASTSSDPPPPHTGEDLKRRSKELTGVEGTADWPKRSGARAFLWAAGWQQEDFRKPIITVACPWTNATPCNNHFRELGDLVCEAVEVTTSKPPFCW